jgi:hypothetical protein
MQEGLVCSRDVPWVAQEEQGFDPWTQGEQQRTKLPLEEQHRRRLPQRKQCEV